MLKSGQPRKKTAFPGFLPSAYATLSLPSVDFFHMGSLLPSCQACLSPQNHLCGELKARALRQAGRGKDSTACQTPQERGNSRPTAWPLADPSPWLIRQSKSASGVIREGSPGGMMSCEWRVSVGLESERGLGPCSGAGPSCPEGLQADHLLCLRNVHQSTNMRNEF